MRTTIKLIFLIFIFGCKNQTNRKIASLPEIKTENSENQSTETIFDLIINKKESPKSFPDSIAYKFDFSKRFTEKEVSVLNLDTTKIDLSEYYFLTNQKFLKKEIDSISFLIYYKHQYGDQLEKILRVNRKDTVFDITLSMQGGDSFSQSVSTEFVSDSIFKETFTHKVGDIIYSEDNGKHSTYEYYCDSIISRYKYDKFLNLKLLQKDTLQFSKQIFYRDNKILWSNLKAYSKSFDFQGQECVWEYIIPNYNSLDGLLYTQNLINNKTKKVILNGQIEESHNEMYSDDINVLFQTNGLNAILDDINFDGENDILIFNRNKSGTAGEFTDVYIFDKKTGSYEFSTFFSGYDCNILKDKKIITYFAKGGGRNYFYKEVHFNNNSNIKFTNHFRSISISNSNELIYEYEKIVDEKTIRKVSDTINSPELELWEWKKKYE